MSGIEVSHSGKEIIEEKIELNNYLSKTASNQKMFNDSRISSFKLKYVLKPTYKISHIRKNSPASEVDLKVGDKIISINNRKAYNYTIQKITDLFQSEDGKKIKMEVEREGKVIEVVFYLKKII
jgi:C-terminal processing protease CtpA/Prc